jgi:predicted exporter
MTARLMRYVSRIVVGHPGLVAAVSLVLTVFLYAHISHLRLGTDLTDLFGNDDPQWKAVSKLGKELGYGNQLFVLIEAPDGSEATEQMEEMAERLTSDMAGSGLFKYARYGLREEELLKMVSLFAWNFPIFLQPDQWQDARDRLSPAKVRQTIRQAGGELVTPFSALGTDYFVTDPLGLMQVVAGASRGFSEFASFDLTWGSGNHFFSKDHKALLIVAEPRQPAVDYQFAQQVIEWTRQHVDHIGAEPDFRNSRLRATPAGAYVYAEEEHKFIEKNIRLISTISILGNLLLCLAIYPRIPLLLLSLLPTSLGILWTTGVASFYPGEVNLISLSFIAILAGLGDDQVVHFFNRVPQEWAKTGGRRAGPEGWTGNDPRV